MKKIYVILMMALITLSSCSGAGATAQPEATPEKEEYAMIWITSDLGKGKCLSEGSTFVITVSMEPTSPKVAKFQQINTTYKVAQALEEDGVAVSYKVNGEEFQFQLPLGGIAVESLTLSFEDGSPEQLRVVPTFRYIGKQGPEFCFADPEEAEQPPHQVYP